ncbi:MAG: retropepsin-like domain-containing protein, partial [Candidatus Eremiobacteraeota bacterium]|nr:retropepsin-like domain-containing protein [Candidatus Eremiobacteraeota bacterium]
MICTFARNLCILLLLVAAVLEPARAETSPKTLLEGLRKAMLSRPYASIASLHTVASVTILGIAGRAQEWDDVRSVRFTMDQNAGALSGASGWDGKVAWSQDYAGLVTIDGGTAGRLQAIDQAYLDNFRYLRQDAGGATVVYAGERTAADQTYDVLAVTPPNGSELALWIDPRTHLIGRITATIGINSSTTVYSRYRRVDGILYPVVASTQLSSGNTFAQRVLSVELNADVADRIRVPGQNVHDNSIASGATTSMPIEVVNNHVYLPNVKLDGHGPYTFVLDSGGDYIVTPEVAAAIQAKTSGSVQLQGVGSATEGAAFAHVGSLAVGNAVVRNQYAFVLPIATGFGLAEGMRIDGMLGYQFLARFLTTIDYAGETLTLAMPSAAPAAVSGAAPMQFFFDGTTPRINVNVNAVTVSAQVDTGNRGAL